ncbi:MAG: D-alanyl-D-alanine carboxypeptidase [Oscillospiraceae bacterium]|jgi:D-alanyl-D-alanine carboxypeptidase (penicillin-binding protein 5/6)|nr:D-alanyl-D-alanine carboxypeptidase [Oscillospiraceae bacterium]
MIIDLFKHLKTFNPFSIFSSKNGKLNIKLKIYLTLAFSIIFLNCSSQIVNSINFDPNFPTTSQSIVLFNLDTDTAIFNKNENERIYPASLTKVMTYIITAKLVKDFINTQVTVKQRVLNELLGTGSSLSYLKDGETWNMKQLLSAMMIASGNDAALVIADHLGQGDTGRFVEWMNEEAGELGCKDTHFTNPHGLHDEQHYTTANDLTKIVKHALPLPDFKEITSKSSSDIFGEDRYPLITTNSMIDSRRGGDYYYEFATGIKTGFTDEAGRCIIASAEKDGYHYICVALKDHSNEKNCAMVDSKNLFEWAFSTMEIKSIFDKNKPIGEIALKYAWQKDHLQLALTQDYFTILPQAVDPNSVDISLNVPNLVEAPVKVGDKIGTATLSYENQILTEIDVISAESVKKSQLLSFVAAFLSIVTSKWFIISVVSLILLISIYIIMVRIYNRNRRAFNKVRRPRR